MQYEVEQALLAIGERICRTDYAVRHYRNPCHPKFYGKPEQLLKALRRAMPGLPKKSRRCYGHWIAAILQDGAAYRPAGKYQSCGEIITDKERLMEALLRLPENALERLIMDAVNALVESYGTLLSDYQGDRSNHWPKWFGKESSWEDVSPDHSGNALHTDVDRRKAAPSPYERWSKALGGKKGDVTLHWLSFGLIELVDHLKGQSLNPFWYYYDIALMVKCRLQAGIADE